MNNPPLILVVDDDWMNRELLQAYLEGGYEVMTANNGEKALTMVESRLPDLVIADVRMPGISGFEFCARLRAGEATSYIPVLMLSGLDGDEPRRMAVQVGASDLISKPFESTILLDRIRLLLNQNSAST
jgi:DNA-binding response OmpR family regulator